MTFDDLTAGLRQIAYGGDEIAKLATPAIVEWVRGEVAEGKAPGGSEWPERAAGGRAYANAAARISGKHYGDLIAISVSGPEYFGHKGLHGMPVRLMLPDATASIPPAISAILAKAATVYLGGLIK